MASSPDECRDEIFHALEVLQRHPAFQALCRDAGGEVYERLNSQEYKGRHAAHYYDTNRIPGTLHGKIGPTAPHVQFRAGSPAIDVGA